MKKISEDLICEITERCCHSEIVEPKNNRDGDYSNGYLFGRLNRAALNQSENGISTFSRYAIWANTARTGILESLSNMGKGDYNDAHRKLVDVANSLAAFSDLQSEFDNPDS